MRVALVMFLAGCGRLDIGPTHFEYLATVADCQNPNAPDLTSCTARKGATELVVDRLDTATMMPWYSYLRFDLDGQLDGVSIGKVTLRAVASDSTDTPANMSGEVWQVGEFAEADLATTVPAKVTGLATDQGPVVKLQVVEWALPATIASAHAVVCLGLYPVTSDGVHYWNLLGDDPPRLIVDAK